MELNKIQNKAIEVVKARCKRRNVERDADILMIHLMEESGELAKQIINKKLKGKEIDLKNIGEEVSDCIIILMNLADYYKIDLEKVLTEKIEGINKK